jgi:hypothetical protein
LKFAVVSKAESATFCFFVLYHSCFGATAHKTFTDTANKLFLQKVDMGSASDTSTVLTELDPAPKNP